MDILGIQHSFVNVDGFRVHYVTAGEGYPLVLLHGMGASVVAWRDNLLPLAQRYRVYAVDLPGHGDSEKRALAGPPSSMSHFLKAFLDAMGISSTTLVGSSMGGGLAILTATDYPEVVNGLVLVDSAGLVKELPLFVRLAAVPIVGELLWLRLMPRDKAFLRPIFHDPRFAEDSLARELSRTRNMPGAKQAVLKILRQGVTLGGLRPEFVLLHNLKRFPRPVLIVWGANDRVLSVAHAHRAASSIPQCSLHIFERCGHWPQMEKAQEFNALVSEFIANQVSVLPGGGP